MAWNNVFAIICISLTACSNSGNGNVKSQTKSDSSLIGITDKNNYSSFELNYSFLSHGTNRCNMQPSLKVYGEQYVYTGEQNCLLNGNFNENQDTFCVGIFRKASIDSIIRIVKSVNNMHIYNADHNIMSGGIHYVSVSFGTVKFNIELHNAFDSTAQKIIDIVNSNLPNNEPKLLLFDSMKMAKNMISAEMNINPFDSLNYDKVVAYDYYDEDRLIGKGGILCDNSKIIAQRELKKNQIEKLHKIINNHKNFGGGTAGCFDPHLGFVYYKQNKIVGHISICLACNFLISSVTIPASLENNSSTGFSNKGRKQFSNICKELQFSNWQLNSPLFD